MSLGIGCLVYVFNSLTVPTGAICKMEVIPAYSLTSFPGGMGGEKAAWYRLLVHVCPFLETPAMYVYKRLLKLVRIHPIHFHILVRQPFRRHFLVHLGCLELVNTVWAWFLGPCVSVQASVLHLHRSGSYVLVNHRRFKQARKALHRWEGKSSCNLISLKRVGEYLGCTAEPDSTGKLCSTLRVCSCA